MNLKKGLFIMAISTCTLVLTACGKKEAPNLTFEETLKVAENAETVKYLTELVMTKDRILEKTLQGKLEANIKNVGKIDLTMDSKGIVDEKTNNTDVNFWLEGKVSADNNPDFSGDISLKLALQVLLKDYQLYLNLQDLNIEPGKDVDQQVALSVGMLGSVVNSLKDKWLTIANPEFSQIMQEVAKQNKLQNQILSYSGWATINPEMYTGVVSTTYQGQPAWEYQIDENKFKEEITKKIAMISDTVATTLTGEELEVYLTGTKAILETVNELKIKNGKGIFVIYSKDNVKSVLEGAEFELRDLVVKVTQSVTEDTCSGTIQASVNTDTQSEIVSGGEFNNITLNYNIEKIKSDTYKFAIVISGNEKTVNIDGKIAIELSKDKISLKPEVSIKFDENQVKFDGKYALDTLKEYTFTAPENAEDIQTVIGGLMGWFGLWTPDLDHEFEENDEAPITGENIEAVEVVTQ